MSNIVIKYKAPEEIIASKYKLYFARARGAETINVVFVGHDKVYHFDHGETRILSSKAEEFVSDYEVLGPVNKATFE